MLWLDLVYLAILTLLAPWLGWRAYTTGRYRKVAARWFGCVTVLAGRPTVWFHAVSVGEVHLLGPIVTRFRAAFPTAACVISTTTPTGLAEAKKRFADASVIEWPFDFSWAVARALDTVRPRLIVLAEGELWPNFLHAAQQRGIPIVVANARLSPRSRGRYAWLGSVRQLFFGPVTHWAVQTEDYADNLRALGVPAERLSVTGSVKYDGANGDRTQPRTSALRELFSLSNTDLVWVVGSTQAPEEIIAWRIYQRLRVEYPQLRLIVVPRQADRFTHVVEQLRDAGAVVVRRSELPSAVPADAVIVVDTIGELGAVWGLADVAFVGGSLDGQRGGQNMIEPAAYGAAVLFGPHVWNFRQPVRDLLAADAAVQVRDETELANAMRRLLTNPAERRRLGQNAQTLVRDQQGATDKTVQILGQYFR